MRDGIILDMNDLREVAAYAANQAADVLPIFERSDPSDMRPRTAVETALAFAQGGRRVKALQDAALAALKAAKETESEAASHAAWAAMCASSAAYLHPLADAKQVKHILGASAHAARALELVSNDSRSVGNEFIRQACRRATPKLVEVLKRYPPAPAGGGRVGALLRLLDDHLRKTSS